MAAWPNQAFHDATDPLDRWLRRLIWIRVVPRAQRHLTAAFLGEINHEEASTAIACVRAFGRSAAPIDAQASELIALPQRRRPRVLALALTDAAGRLPEMLRTLMEALALSAPSETLFRALDRPQTPHLTVARARRGARMNPPDLDQQPAIQAAFPIHELALVRSTLTPAGPRYETIASAPLTGGAASEPA